MAQTPQQRKANAAYARAEAKKMGKPQVEAVNKKEKVQKAPISKTWLYVLLFVVCGGIVFELLQIIFAASSNLFR